MARDEKRILVVDDDDAIRTLIFTILRRRGLLVDTARNGAEALEKVEQCRYVLILLDLMMPIVHGWEVLERLQEFDPSVRPLVIVLTAGGEPHDFNRDFVVGSIKKPFDVQLLHDIVIGCLSAGSPAESEEKTRLEKEH